MDINDQARFARVRNALSGLERWILEVRREIAFEDHLKEIQKTRGYGLFFELMDGCEHYVQNYKNKFDAVLHEQQQEEEEEEEQEEEQEELQEEEDDWELPDIPPPPRPQRFVAPIPAAAPAAAAAAAAHAHAPDVIFIDDADDDFEEIRPLKKKMKRREEKECSICLMDVYDESEPSFARIAECKHEFHPYCIRQWLKTSKTCPCCRKRTRRRLLILPTI